MDGQHLWVPSARVIQVRNFVELMVQYQHYYIAKPYMQTLKPYIVTTETQVATTEALVATTETLHCNNWSPSCNHSETLHCKLNWSPTKTPQDVPKNQNVKGCIETFIDYLLLRIHGTIDPYEAPLRALYSCALYVVWTEIRILWRHFECHL